VEFVEGIPKSPSGKILRRVLKDRVKEGEVGVVVTEVAKAKL
jgi:4-coumarate--CoA ligase